MRLSSELSNKYVRPRTNQSYCSRVKRLNKALLVPKKENFSSFTMVQTALKSSQYFRSYVDFSDGHSLSAKQRDVKIYEILHKNETMRFTVKNKFRWEWLDKYINVVSEFLKICRSLVVLSFEMVLKCTTISLFCPEN